MKLAVIVVGVLALRAILVIPVLLRRQPSNQKQLPTTDVTVVPEVPKPPRSKSASEHIGIAAALAAAGRLRKRS